MKLRFQKIKEHLPCRKIIGHSACAIWMACSGSAAADSMIYEDPKLQAVDKEKRLRWELQKLSERSERRYLTPSMLHEECITRDHEYVLIDAVAKGKPDILLNELKMIGLRSSAVHGRIISGLLPVDSLNMLEELQSLNEVMANRIITNQGHVTSKGDRAQRSEWARQNYDVDGSGVTIGVMSDSYNCLGGESADKESGDLPATAVSVEDALICDGKTDEGRALMQIVHDVAPGARLIFHSSANGLAKTANAILKLAFEYNVDVIIDDTKTLTANYFQEDVISQAVAKVVSAGVVHVTAAGNSGRNSYQSPYNEYVNPVFQLNAHDFDPGESIDIYQRIRVLEGSGFVMLLQWDSPAYSISGGAGSRTDLDVYLFDQNHTNILASSAYGNIGRDPVEVLSFHNPLGSGKTKFDLMITKAYGKSPGLLKYIILNSNDGIIQEFVTGSSSIFGHANSESAITVGAANYKETPEFGTVPPLLQSYSSAGGTPLLLELNAEVIANPILPKKPDLVAPDNVNTTFFGYDSDNDGMPNISGTSAAAPHAAGVVALLLENRPDLQPADIKNIMQRTSIDMVQRNDEENTEIGLGVDWDSGYGLIDAYAALNLSDDYQASAPIEPVDEDSGSLNVNDPNHTGGGGVLGVFSMMLLSTLLVLSNRLGAKK